MSSPAPGASANPLVSCLCVTEGRAAFMPWLLWCFDRQTWPHRELVILDSSERPFASARNDVRVVALPPGTGVARKRNLAMRAARGDVIAWFDDDDWQHPQKLAWHVEALRTGAAYAGSASGWFVDLHRSSCEAFRAQHGLHDFQQRRLQKRSRVAGGVPGRRHASQRYLLDAKRDCALPQHCRHRSRRSVLLAVARG